MTLESIHPATGAPLARYQTFSPQEVEKALLAVERAQLDWNTTPFSRRAATMSALAELLVARAPSLAERMAAEMGKPLCDGVAEAKKCAWVCDYYAGHAEGFLAREPVATETAKSFVTFQPLGTVLAVMPWNFPFWQVFRFAAPALMAGNAGVLKHASNVTGCALEIEQLFLDAGFPENLFRTLVIESEQVKSVIEHPAVHAVTLTGSTAAGQAVASQAGAALKKCVLELGGSDPYVILDDADLELAVQKCVASRLINTGQSCIAAKRFIVTRKNQAEFESRFVAEMQRYVVGDPREASTQLGPLARLDLREELHQQVEASVSAGARLLLGGVMPDGPGAYYPPTVLTDVAKGSPAYDDELFGPVAAIIPVDTEAEAIEVANDSCFGLGAAVFTQDLARGEEIAANELAAGCCVVNDFVKSDPRLPFGGIKTSGFGRELSHYGIKEFVNIKTVVVG